LRSLGHVDRMTASLIKRAIKPQDCTLAFGIPTSIEEYRTQRMAPQGHDFLFLVARNESDYRWAVLDDIERLVPAIEQTGARVERATTLEGFAALLRDPSRLVVTLFSHWNNDSVEFADGMASIPRIIEVVSPDYSGILDLCVCHPIDLVTGLRLERPRLAAIKHTEASARVDVWLWFYLALFKVLQDEELSWLDAVETTMERLER
jgi:hypothetical protein